MEQIIRYRNIAYIVFGLLMVWLCAKTGALVLTLVGPRADRELFAGVPLSAVLGVACAAAITWYAVTNTRAHNWVTEVIAELTKVTWPEPLETRTSTYIVIVFSVLVSVVLAAFDFIWKFTTDLIL